MTDAAPKLRLIDAQAFERPVKLRLPFRFGVVTLREAPQLFIRTRVRMAAVVPDWTLMSSSPKAE